LFDKELFEKHVATSWLGRGFYFFEELPSTNSYAKKMKDDSSLHGAIVLTDFQNSGRGQSDRKWFVEPDKNLTFSIIFEPQKADRFILLTLACALSIAETVYENTGIKAVIKWPNDVILNGKKVCGILTESQFSGDNISRLIIGIGLNVNQQAFYGELEGIATSIKEESGEETDREMLLAEILQKIEYRYRQWNQFDTKLVKQINEKMIGYGQWTNLLLNGKELEGTYKFLGVNEAGQFVALDEDMNVKTYSYEQIRVEIE
jgi:BirA family biotin operon repressor/biotin-[acetyl-CoA-carboxylase] ligase